MRLVVLSLPVLMLATGAFADCAGPLETFAKVRIEKVSAPVIDPQGNLQEGCFLHANGKVLGYSTEEALCHGSVGRTVSVRLAHYGCCDTGPDDGDFTRIIRSIADDGTKAAQGNGVTVFSVAGR
ncbi:hypothetical protein ABAC460_20420 [Asticcacaulis sp. AC460]|uniref:hypothetical protein n=1 Tax=Asticcacaulis sp. AC460 TaxID=1282360 RepID=UPI0003C3B42C|nr:hypothetical protein [Asticcacaulis sp. AC460]ESQ87391.1 hypothetical protein ABAC460_20420 [Asticcacaulis sp. AC460]